jgi:hypothetical protein
VLMDFLGRLSRVRVEIDALEPARPREHRPSPCHQSWRP